MEGDNKKKVIAVAGVALLCGAAWLIRKLWKQYHSQGSLAEEDGQKNVDLKLTRIKSEIGLAPSFELIKEGLTLSMMASKKAAMQESKKLEERRRTFNQKAREERMADYIKILAQGLKYVAAVGAEVQQEKIGMAGISQHMLMNYQYELASFFNEQVEIIAKPDQSVESLTLKDTQKALQLQIEYLENHGNELVDRLISVTPSLNDQEVRLLPQLFNVILFDEVYQDHPEIDEGKLMSSMYNHKDSLHLEMQKVANASRPLLLKLSKGAGLAPGMGMGMGMPDMDMFEGMEEEDGMGPFGGQMGQYLMGR